MLEVCTHDTICILRCDASCRHGTCVLIKSSVPRITNKNFSPVEVFFLYCVHGRKVACVAKLVMYARNLLRVLKTNQLPNPFVLCLETHVLQDIWNQRRKREACAQISTESLFHDFLGQISMALHFFPMACMHSPTHTGCRISFPAIPRKEQVHFRRSLAAPAFNAFVST